MYIFLIETKNGKYVSTGKDLIEAKFNFSQQLPSEKIRSITKCEQNVLKISLPI